LNGEEKDGVLRSATTVPFVAGSGLQLCTPTPFSRKSATVHCNLEPSLWRCGGIAGRMVQTSSKCGAQYASLDATTCRYKVNLGRKRFIARSLKF
jgi:hypothetical protein